MECVHVDIKLAPHPSGFDISESCGECVEFFQNLSVTDTCNVKHQAVSLKHSRTWLEKSQTFHDCLCIHLTACMVIAAILITTKFQMIHHLLIFPVLAIILEWFVANANQGIVWSRVPCKSVNYFKHLFHFV